MTHLSPEIALLIAGQEAVAGIDISDLKSGSVLKVRTQNSEYVLALIQDGDIWICESKRFPRPRRATFVGSTWGGSMIKPGWIGLGMSLEFRYRRRTGLRTLVTTGVEAVTVSPEAGVTFLLGEELPACTS